MKTTRWILILAVPALIVAAILFLTIRRTLAARDIERAWQAPVPEVPAPATTSQLEIIPLYEKAGDDDKFVIGHGVSYLVRTDDATVLLDVGHNPEASAVAPFMQNMQTLDLSPDEVDAILISHVHPDHVGGIAPWRKKTISLGAEAGRLDYAPAYVPQAMSYTGATFSRDPTLVKKDVATTGVLAYAEVFPLSLFKPQGSEQALVVHVAGEGLVLITGCGHPTVEKLVTRAEALYGQPVVGVVGGLHYGEASAEDLTAPIAFLASREPRLVALSPHDSGPAAIGAFRAAFPAAYREIMVGQAIRFPEG